MEKFYTIKENYAEILLEKRIYPLIVVEKAGSSFLENTFIKIEENDDKIVVQMVLQKEGGDIKAIVGEFCNECLRECLRYNLAKETKNLRELIVGRALYTTCIDVDENGEEQQKLADLEENDQDEYNLDEIAVNWFDNYNNKED